MSAEYTEDIGKQIIQHLDGWAIISLQPTPAEEVQPFIDDIATYTNNPNKKVTENEVEKFYYAALSKAYLYCNRFNVDDLNKSETELFVEGVCCWAASDLWNKYNIRVNNEDMEDVYFQSYGGLLYKQAVNILNPFINQRIKGLTQLAKKDKNDDIWII